MKKTKFLICILFILLIFLFGCVNKTDTINSEEIYTIDNKQIESTIGGTTMILKSPAFQNNGKIPSKYTCDGSNINPSLEISEVPSNAKSLVLLVDDPDIPESVKKSYGISVWDHWVVFNIPVNINKIEEGRNPQGVLGRNTGGKNSYGGPCPPDREHRYFFKLYAVDTLLDLEAGSTKKEVESAMEGHIVEKAELVGRYERKS